MKKTSRIESASWAAAFTPGQAVTNEGIFVGLYQPSDKAHISLSKTFAAFAAPRDLGLDNDGNGSRLYLMYNDAVKAVSALRGVMGRDGAQSCHSDTALYDAMKKGTYDGGWVVPPTEMINGRKHLQSNIWQYRTVQADNLLDRAGAGALRGTISPHDFYWSSTEMHQNAAAVLVIRADVGDGGWELKNGYKFLTRPMRFVEIRPA